MNRVQPLLLAHWLLHRFDEVYGEGIPARAALYGVDVVDADALWWPHGTGGPAARLVFAGEAPDLAGGDRLVDRHLPTVAGHDAAVLTGAMWVGGAAVPLRPGAYVGRRRARVLTVVCDAGGVTVLSTGAANASVVHGPAPVPGSAALFSGWRAARAG